MEKYAKQGSTQSTSESIFEKLRFCCESNEIDTLTQWNVKEAINISLSSSKSSEHGAKR